LFVRKIRPSPALKIRHRYCIRHDISKIDYVISPFKGWGSRLFTASRSNLSNWIFLEQLSNPNIFESPKVKIIKKALI